MTDSQLPEPGEKPAPPIQAEAVTRPSERKRLASLQRLDGSCLRESAGHRIRSPK